MHKLGESVLSVEAGSAADWLQLLVVFGSIAVACLVIGALIGLLLHRRRQMQIPVGLVVSLVSYAVMEWLCIHHLCSRHAHSI